MSLSKVHSRLPYSVHPLTAATTNPTPSTSNTQSDPLVLSVLVPDFPGQSGVLIRTQIDQSPMALISRGFQNFQNGKIPTFMDLGMSDTMFVSRDVFTEYKSVTPRTGDSAKAVDGGFEIIGEGNVIQRYQVNEKEQKITYTHVLHTPTLNANLVSVSAFDKAGLTTIFGNGLGIVQKVDGMVVLIGQQVNGMYLLETIDNIPDTPLAMASSLSHPTSLEQWHRQFAHCSPLRIQDMASQNLVDGLKISEMTVNGKCEDCILGRQTC